MHALWAPRAGTLLRGLQDRETPDRSRFYLGCCRGEAHKEERWLPLRVFRNTSLECPAAREHSREAKAPGPRSWAPVPAGLQV